MFGKLFGAVWIFFSPSFSKSKLSSQNLSHQRSQILNAFDDEKKIFK